MSDIGKTNSAPIASPNGAGISTADAADQASRRMRQIADLVNNALMSRETLFSKFLDSRRDINDECGYPETNAITSTQYRALYDREPIAVRVVEVMPRESWRVQPSVYESEDISQVTPFEEAWARLGKQLMGNNWFRDEEGNPIWEYLQRADELSGIGSFGAILLGVDDGQDLSMPLDIIDRSKAHKGRSSTRQLLFLRVFDESLLNVLRFEKDINNPRFGCPLEYSMTFSDPRHGNKSDASLTLATKRVHWTRVIHLADNLGSSEIFGVPRMQPVYNRLCDLRKLYAGSAEMYWRGAFPGLSIETHPQLGGDVSVNDTSLRAEMEDYTNGLQRYLRLTGMSAKSLAPQVVDPSPQIDKQIEGICIRLGIPKRIFTGSERGQLASGQDSRTWRDRIKARQNGYLTPRVIVPFVNRLISVGVLPVPDGYSVVWPDADTLSPEENASVAEKHTNSMAKYVQGGVEALVPPVDYLTRVLGFSPVEAESILENAMGVEDVGDEG